jgi:PAS domain S-box-containing protein
MHNPFLKGNTVLRGSEKDLSESERYYRTLIHSLHEDLLVINCDHRIVDINNMALQTLGKTRQEVIGRLCYEVSHGLSEPCNKHGSPCPLHQVFETGEPVNCRHEHVMSSGRIVLVDILTSPIKDSEGNVTHVIEAIRDISDLFEAQEALRKNQAFLNTLLDAIPTPVFYKDKSGRYLGCNRTFETFFGTPREQLISKTVFNTHSPELAEIYHAKDTELFESEGIQQYESQFKNTHGVLRDVIFNKAVFTDSQGAVSGMVGVILDITERKQAENAAKIAEEQLRLKLDSILSPDADIRLEELCNIIDKEALQSLMDDFYAVTGMGIGVIDLKGNVLVGTGWQDVCTKFHRVNPLTLKNCIESDIMLSRGVKPGEFNAYKCKNNLWDIVTPIFIGDRHVGNVFLGQFFYDDEPIDYQLFTAQAERYGFNKEEYLAALKNIPVWSRDKVLNLMKFYAKFAKQISKLSYSNLKLARSMCYYKQAEEERQAHL